MNSSTVFASMWSESKGTTAGRRGEGGFDLSQSIGYDCSERSWLPPPRAVFGNGREASDCETEPKEAR